MTPPRVEVYPPNEVSCEAGAMRGVSHRFKKTVASSRIVKTGLTCFDNSRIRFENHLRKNSVAHARRDFWYNTRVLLMAESRVAEKFAERGGRWRDKT